MVEITGYDYMKQKVFGKDRFNTFVDKLFYLKYETATIALNKLFAKEIMLNEKVQFHSNFNKIICNILL